MLKKLMSFLLVGLFLIPSLALAADKEYTSLNLKQVLEEEQIESKLGNYSESSNKVNVYLFRGKGCYFCKGFINFLNDHIDELGKYFNLVSYEVWNNKDNNSLLKQVASFTGEDAGGVPYIIVGETVFAGFTEEAYGQDFINTLKAEFDKKERYDVFEEMKKAEKNANKSSSVDTNKIIIWNAIFTCVVLVTFGVMYSSINKKLDQISANSRKTIVKEEVKKEEKSTAKNQNKKSTKKK